MTALSAKLFRQFFTALFLGLTSLLCCACDAYGDEKAPDFRYRLTVEVDTPEGVRTGSSVIEVQQSIGGSADSGYKPRVFRRARGEAVAVDLPGGRTLYALLHSNEDNQWSANIMSALAPEYPGEALVASLDNVFELEIKLLLSGEHGYPILVTFADPAEPKSILTVSPTNLAAAFGEGFVLNSVSVELTLAPRTTEIEGRLPWLRSVWPNMLSGDRFQSIENQSAAGRIAASSFSTELGK